MATIYINYTPSLDLDQIEEISREQFPKYDVSQVHRIANYVNVRRNPFVSTNIVVKHQPNKDRTKIVYNGNCDMWVTFLVGALWHYVVRGKFMTEIKRGLIKGLLLRYNGIQFFQ